MLTFNFQNGESISINCMQTLRRSGAISTPLSLKGWLVTLGPATSGTSCWSGPVSSISRAYVNNIYILRNNYHLNHFQDKRFFLKRRIYETLGKNMPAKI